MIIRFICLFYECELFPGVISRFNLLSKQTNVVFGLIFLLFLPISQELKLLIIIFLLQLRFMNKKLVLGYSHIQSYIFVWRKLLFYSFNKIPIFFCQFCKNDLNCDDTFLVLGSSSFFHKLKQLLDNKYQHCIDFIVV